ncbi:hypothetical protein HWV23_10645 [Natronomonas halophila]|uniref:DUF7261 family protein n=1 Tax=Natronomonas halophila TaxID=2747817 RepID=UPI0015B6AB81|nr:hypothetical protein [Natronomonas halophila]QLD86162.1 hypothetical protein HWV23_10645 [Natronomonas halophila]
MSQSGSGAGRGQLLVITALVLAIVLVSLALVLNSAIYTENLSSRSSGNSDDALSVVSITFETIDIHLERVNARHNNSHEDLTQNYTQLTNEFQNAQSNGYANRGISFDATTIGQTNGTQLRQTNQSRAFTNASGDASDWQVAGGVSGISDYTMVVNRDGLYTDGGGDILANSSTVYITNESGTVWQLHIYENTNNNVTVKPVVDGTEEPTCEVDAAEVEIDFVAGAVGGRPCSTLVFAEGLEGTLDIEYHNPDEIAGTYSLRVDVTIDPATNDHYVAFGTGSPTATLNIYATTTRITYDSSEVSYASTQRIVAGEQAYTE